MVRACRKICHKTGMPLRPPSTFNIYIYIYIYLSWSLAYGLRLEGRALNQPAPLHRASRLRVSGFRAPAWRLSRSVRVPNFSLPGLKCNTICFHGSNTRSTCEKKCSTDRVGQSAETATGRRSRWQTDARPACFWASGFGGTWKPMVTLFMKTARGATSSILSSPPKARDVRKPGFQRFVEREGSGSLGRKALPMMLMP